MNGASLKQLEHRDFRNLDRLIEDRGLEIRCSHCNTTSIQALGWLRGRPDMECGACQELILLDTMDLRDTIRATSRQLRDLSVQLHEQFPSWT